jgi:hypothetical protein
MNRLHSWIDINRLNWKTLSNNYNAIDILKVNQDKINWINLSSNLNAIDILKSNLEKINWKNIICK